MTITEAVNSLPQKLHKYSMEFAQANAEYELVDEMKESELARISAKYDKGEYSEAKLKRMAVADPEWIEYLESKKKMLERKLEAKAGMESTNALIDLVRSKNSYDVAAYNADKTGP